MKPILALAFYIVLTPVAIIRRALGYDPMALKKWKQGRDSVFVSRDHTYTANEMDSPS